MGRLSIKRKQTGQGMTEYIIIVALIAVAAIGVYQFFGQTIRSQTAGIAREVAGHSAQDGIRAANTASQGALNETGSKGLANYDNDDARNAGAGGGGGN